MRRVFVALLTLVAGLLAAEARYDLMRVDVSEPEQVRILEQAGCIVNGFDQSGKLVIEVPQDRVGRLLDAGWRLEMLMEDVTGFYERNAQDYRFHTYTQIKDTFMEMARNNPSFVKFETLGYASNDSLLFALKITDNPNAEEDEPELMFEAAIHGDEKCATEPVFEWAVYLIRNYGVDPQVTYWVNTREIWVQCPTNPYGHIVGQRANRNGVDCNRDYGFMWYYETSFREGFTQPETRAHLRLIQRNAFNYWSSGHGGTYCISTPWSYSPYGTRDSMEIQYLAQLYHNITGYPYGPGYRVMYRINGSSKDYAYGALGGIGWTVETCIYKTPPVESLAPIIAREHAAMRMVMVNIDRGVRGIVTDSITGAPIRARVRPMPINFPSYCDSIGDYHRYLRPGTYSLVFEANGYRPKTVTGVVVTADTVTRVDVRLAPDPAANISLHQFVSGRGVSDVQISSTPDLALGPRDGRRFSLGRGGFAVYDFGQVVVNVTGQDFTVYEDDADPEGYRVDVANDPLGPWTRIGWDTGTASFELGSVSSFRYIRITDDSGAVSGPTAGFDLDAIEAVVPSVPAVVYYDKVVLDSPPGGNGNGRLDPDETVALVLGLKNIGRQPVADLVGRLSTRDTFVSVLDSTAAFGLLAPDSVRYCWTDRFRVSARPNTPREYQATMKLVMEGSDYRDSLTFRLTVGELRMCDPIPDGPRQPPLYWCYDDTDTGYAPCPTYDWVEIRGRGTRLSLGDDQTVQLNLPAGFGPWRFYGQSFSQISVCSNGWVAPGATTSTTHTPVTLPDPSVPSAVYLNWTNLYPPAGGGVWYFHDTANHRFIVEFDSVRYYSGGLYDKFELVLYDTTVRTPSGDNLFLVQFYSNNGGYGGIGMQDPSKTIAINYAGPAAAPVQPGRAIKYTTEYGTGIAESRIANAGCGLEVAPSFFRRTARVNWWIPAGCRAELRICDATGRVVRTLEAGRAGPGRHSSVWNGTDDSGQRVPPGIYFVRLDAGTRRLAGKAILVE